MDEYIEREALLKDAAKNRAIGLCEADIVDVRELINEQPAADVAPVVHGWWIDTGFFNSYKSPIYKCSACHKEVYDHYIGCHKYCLHCGARMDGDTNG